MDKSKLYQCTEGLLVTITGVVFVILSLGIRDNPVAVESKFNLIVEAKFAPLALSVLIAIQGLTLAISQWRGNDRTSHDGGFTPRALIVGLLTVAYLYMISLVGFTVPTVVYVGALLFVVNKGRKPLLLLALTALYSIIALLLIPLSLNLQLL